MSAKLLLPLGILGLLAGCRKEKMPLETLPAATQEGKNTAGCLVDGQGWQPEATSWAVDNPIHVTWFPHRFGRGLDIHFSRVYGQGSHNTSVSFWVPDIRRPGTYQLNQAADPRRTTANPPYGGYTNYVPFPGKDYLTGPAATGTLTVTRLDTVAKVVSGTFELHPQTADGQVVHITHGRFDLTYPQ